MNTLGLIGYKLLFDGVNKLNRKESEDHKDLKKKIQEEREKSKEREKRYLRGEFKKD